jgi:hypothetical protein
MTYTFLQKTQAKFKANAIIKQVKIRTEEKSNTNIYPRRGDIDPVIKLHIWFPRERGKKSQFLKELLLTSKRCAHIEFYIEDMKRQKKCSQPLCWFAWGVGVGAGGGAQGLRHAKHTLYF